MLYPETKGIALEDMDSLFRTVSRSQERLSLRGVAEGSESQFATQENGESPNAMERGEDASNPRVLEHEESDRLLG